MNLDYVMLAEAAGAGEGKQFIHGAGLRRIDAAQLPWVAPVAVVMRFTASLDELGNHHELVIRLLRPSGEQMFETPPIELDVPAEVGPPDREEVSVQISIQTTVPFPDAGWYVFELMLDDQPLAQLRLRIALRTSDESDP